MFFSSSFFPFLFFPVFFFLGGVPLSNFESAAATQFTPPPPPRRLAGSTLRQALERAKAWGRSDGRIDGEMEFFTALGVETGRVLEPFFFLVF